MFQNKTYIFRIGDRSGSKVKVIGLNFLFLHIFLQGFNSCKKIPITDTEVVRVYIGVVKISNLTDYEFSVIKRQLSRSDAWAESIVVRCRFGYPVVIYHPPYRNGRVHPTLFWLTCPLIKHHIDYIESTKAIKELEERLMVDNGLMEEFSDNQDRFNDFLSKRCEEIEIDEKIGKRLKGLYIGGSAGKGVVKCFHSHFAVLMAGFDTIAGRVVLERLRAEFPGEIEFIFGGRV